MRKRKALSVLLFCFISLCSFAQEGVSIEGYVFEDGNRGYLNLANVTIVDPATGQQKGLLITDENGVFKCQLPVGKEYELFIEKDLFKQYTEKISTVGKQDGEKIFIKCQLERQPGYLFEVTIAEKRADMETPANAITGATIEVFNNSTEEQLLTLLNHPTQEFKCHFNDGNHYTILIRKKGYFNKRMEAFVNVKGCILCFEGVGEVKPSDVLTEGNSMGTLLANVELEPIVMDEGMLLDNIYYDYDKANITETAAFELDKLINVLTINPALVVELGSHTDSRGDDDYNFKLSSRRAKEAVAYILRNSDIEKHRIRYQGYGEIQPKNKCKNGVTCSEEQHAENRRTELKVVGLLDIDPYEDKTLKDIIDVENFNKLLEELQDQEQVRVVPGEEVPDFLKEEDKEKEDASKIASETAKEEMEEPIVEKPAVKEITEAVKEEIVETVKVTAPAVKEPVIEQPKPKASKVIEEVAVVVEEAKKPVIERPVFEKPKVETPKVVEKPVLKEPVIETPIKTEEVVEVVTEKVEPEKVITKTNSVNSNEVTASSDSRIFSEPTVETPRPSPRPVKMPENYTGYRIEFYNSPYELPGSHEIFYKHGRITLDKAKNGTFSYLLGAFKELKDAEDFLKNIITQQYPSAKVIRYKKGNRSNG